ncbi:hypothetical protein [Nonomuraea sp. B5E05]|uniref:hypothetical protein n=1 Tax=Nonomuraea sp. B5E05 TaxID=3153569 RepID=UPI0032604B8B
MANTPPQSFDDAKFGVMVVWGPASIPAYAPPWSFGEDVPNTDTLAYHVTQLDLTLHPGAEVRLREHGPTLPWTATTNGVRVELPEIPHPEPAFTVRLAPASAISG